MDADAGLAAAVEAALAAAPALPVRGATAEQLALLPEGRRAQRVDIERIPRGRGRPAGARNRRTVAWRDYLASRYTHPLEVLAAIASTPVDVLAAQLGCELVAALQIIKSAAAELAPYMESKMPVGLAIGKLDDLPMLVIEGLTHTAEEVGEVLAGAFIDYHEGDGETLEDQGLDDAAGTTLE